MQIIIIIIIIILPVHLVNEDVIYEYSSMVFTDGGVFYFSWAFFVICVFHTMFSSVI